MIMEVRMYRKLYVTALIAAALACSAAAVVAEKGPTGWEMETYYVGLIFRGPAWTPEKTPEIMDLQKAHLANITRLAESGKLVLAGPFVDDGDLRGMFVFRVSSIEEARALCDTDPAVKAGRLRVDLHPWYSAKGIAIVQEADSAAARAR
jgi:uncharacterized protein YciI